jgi:hypothetical protein
VKLLGWIKSAVEFIKLPASPRQDAPQPDAPREVDGGTLPQDTGPDRIDIRPESPASVETESQTSAEIESQISAEIESRDGGESEGLPTQEEIDRRRGIVRQFFNDYWSVADDKPPSFAERLDRAESYINERVAADGEFWRLDPATRKQLGLPPPRKK